MASTGELAAGRRPALFGLGVLCGLAALMTIYSVWVAVTEVPWDFQWSGARLLVDGCSPYEVFLRSGPDAFVGTQFPNYAPLLYLLLAPLGALPLPTATVVWAVLNVVLAASSAVMVGRGAGFSCVGTVGLAAALMVSISFYDAVAKGQQSLLVLFAAVVAARSVSNLAGGSGLAVMLAKYSFAPVALMYVARDRWRALAVAAGIHVGAVAVFCLVTGSGVVDAVPGPLRVAQTMYPGSGNVMTLLGGGPVAFRYGATLAAAVILAAAGWRTLRDGTWVESLAAASLIGLATFPHLLYDYVFLLPVAAVGFRLRGWRRAAVLAVLVPTWFNWALGGISAYDARWAWCIFVLTLLSIVGGRGPVGRERVDGNVVVVGDLRG